MILHSIPKDEAAEPHGLVVAVQQGHVLGQCSCGVIFTPYLDAANHIGAVRNQHRAHRASLNISTVTPDASTGA